jgi:DNA-binding CsgD family transcriptional regulator
MRGAAVREEVRVEEVGTALGLFGRQDVLRVVSDALDRGGSAVVVGDPGAGKSSLMKAAAQRAQCQGRRLLSVAPTRFERGLPFAGLAELFGQCPEGADSALPGPQRRALAVALQRVEPEGREVDALAVPLAVRALLKQLGEAEPITLLIDDLQWLDQASVGSLAFAIRGLSAEPHRLSVLVATRPDPETGTDLIRCLAEPRQMIALPPLQDWAIGQLLRRRLGPRWTPPMVAGVARASGGNPFLAVEIARAMQDDLPNQRGSARYGHDPVFPVPPSLVELLRERVARLPPDAREVLLLVSAAGRLTMAQSQGIVEETLLRSALESAADADVAIVSAESVVAFTHPLLASAIYDAAAPADRRRAHRVLAEKLQDPVERARHRAKSITVPDEAVAAELERAADISLSRGTQQIVGELLERAALATPTDVDTAAGLGRWLRAVDSYRDAGDEIAAKAALDRGSALATIPEQRAQVLVRRARLAEDFRTARPFAEQAFRLAPAGSEVRAEILTMLGQCHREEGHGRLALRLFQMAVTEAAALGRPDLQLAALNERQIVERLWGLGEPEQSMRDIEQLVDSSARDPSIPRAWARGWFAAWNDETAERHVRDGIQWAVDVGQYGDMSSLSIALIFVLIRSSQVRAARAALNEADRSGAWTITGGCEEDMARVLVKAYAGDLDEGRELARRALARPRVSRSPYWRAGFLAQLGFIEAAAGNWHAALEPLREIAEILESTKMVDLEQLLWAVDYADAALQAGAMHDVETAIAVLRRQGTAGRPEASVAANRCQALVTAARGDTDKALNELRGIVEQPGSECPFEAARSRLALGQVYRRAGFKALSSETLNTAADAFEEMGTPRWAERARAEAGRVGLYPTTGTLTVTERRVAELVGSGRSNQETAAQLFMSVKTVEANLTRIYRKLDVRSRTELAHHIDELDSAARD